MKRHVPGLHGARQNADTDLEGLFLVRVERAFYRWHPQKPFFALCLSVLEPKEYAGRTISGRLYSTPRALWKLSWFLRDFGYDPDLLGRDEVDERALRGAAGSRPNLPHRAQRSPLPQPRTDSLLRPTGRNFRRRWSAQRTGRRPPMTYSYTQISQYLRCPRSYRYRYLDGWREKDTRASLLFGRCIREGPGGLLRRRG